MEKSLIVRGGPQEYVCKIGAWDLLEEHLLRHRVQSVLILHGEQSWEAARPWFPELLKVKQTFMAYGGKCTQKKIDEFSDLITQQAIQGVVAVGGGTVSDLAKAAAFASGVPVFILPTLAATCSAYTSLSVLYREDGSMDHHIIFPKSITLTLVDPQVIMASPRPLMIAGIGDTLAKWYEANAIIEQLNVLPVELEVAHFAARMCKDHLLTFSYDALAAMEAGVMNDALVSVIETNIVLGGMVGSFGDDYGRTAGAHPIHDALTQIPQSHHHLHGNKVAYGILVQLVIENKWQDIEELMPFYHKLKLPTSLYDMSLLLSDEQIQQVAQRATHPDETIYFMKQTIDEHVVIGAMEALERYSHQRH